ncbi:MAG TPA: VWA domain-containing protein [Vicinamibacterales bacterium]|nr:VWA domain-containing protein [Vicinamibacterales bacterium]
MKPALQIAALVLAVSQPPTFSTGARTVAVYATVRSATGGVVPDLERESFEVADNGRPQPLTQFAHDLQPITVVMLLDRSASMIDNFAIVAAAAETFVDAMGPADKARIGSFSNRVQVDPRTFTSSHDELKAILKNELQEPGPTPLWNAIDVGITALLHEQGRRVILVFTDGRDNPMTTSVNNSSLRDVTKRADEEDLMIYAIGLASGESGRHLGYGRGHPVDDRPDEGLPKLAEGTGGGYFELTSTNDLKTTFERVAYELHHQYLLGFTPASLDGRMHTLTVRVVTPPGMDVRARKNYLAALR